MVDLDKCYETIIELVKQGGQVRTFFLSINSFFAKTSNYFQVIRNNINKQKTVANKSCDVDLVTDTDKGVEKLLIHGIAAKFPDHKYDFKS